MKTSRFTPARRFAVVPDERIATTYCDINGERRRTDEFLYVPLRERPRP